MELNIHLYWFKHICSSLSIALVGATPVQGVHVAPSFPANFPLRQAGRTI